MVPGSLDDVLRHMPRTIQDAIALTRGLKQRYLWVDSLCLLQNDRHDLDEGVEVMDLVYEKALLTIVAACGHDSNSGLPGVRPGTRNAENGTVEVLPGVYLGIYCMLDRLFNRTSHASRAWTLQEQALSRRVLYFVDDKVYFRCQVSTRCERIDPRLDDKSAEDAHSSIYYFFYDAMRMQVPCVDYHQVIYEYSLRGLTDQRDALRAMRGLSRRFSQSWRCRFLEGMPTAAFDIFMVFRGGDLPLHRRSSHPSYSWAGWRGPLLPEFTCGTQLWLDQATWIVWYKRSPNNVLSLVWDPLANESFPTHDREVTGYRTRRTFNRKYPLPFPTTRTSPTEELEIGRELPSYPILQFWTISVFYNLRITDPIKGIGSLLDRNGSECGTVKLDGLEETIFFESGGPFEAIVLSEDSRPELLNAKDPTQYYVLLLEWDEGLAERRGIGTVDMKSITMGLPPGASWKEILL
ncbi:hypothetical protein BX600DRAFT_447091, partial [Xylariales sp. PMI_506]